MTNFIWPDMIHCSCIYCCPGRLYKEEINGLHTFSPQLGQQLLAVVCPARTTTGTAVVPAALLTRRHLHEILRLPAAPWDDV